jgi:chemotaxis methyl-accepting protein methylase
MNIEINDVRDIMQQVHGKDIGVYAKSFLQKTFEKRMAAAGYASIKAYGQFLARNAAEAETLFRSLNITYSEFFRNPLTFAVLEQMVLPRMIREKKENKQKEIRVWSAGCASGQEAYSIAMLLDQLTASRESRISFRIFATDVSSEALETARAGIYPLTAVENVRLKYYRRYFTEQKETCIVNEGLKRFIDFSAHDLLDSQSFSPASSIYGDFDLILCCNLLYYYRSKMQLSILEKLQRALSPFAYLVSGEVEQNIVEKNNGFLPLVWPAAIFQKVK